MLSAHAVKKAQFIEIVAFMRMNTLAPVHGMHVIEALNSLIPTLIT